MRISDDYNPVVGDGFLQLAAFELAKSLATEDKPEAVNDKIVALDPLKVAKNEGFTGTAVKHVVHVEDAAVGRKVTDTEAGCMSAMAKWCASKVCT